MSFVTNSLSAPSVYRIILFNGPMFSWWKSFIFHLRILSCGTQFMLSPMGQPIKLPKQSSNQH